MTKTLTAPQVFEGSWEEVSLQAEKFAEHQVRLIILPLADKEPGKSTRTKPIPGLIPPKFGNGTFEDIMALMEDKVSFSEDDSLMEAILENRAMRRSILNSSDIE